MAHIKYNYSAAAVSWIDPKTGLPEVDKTPPGTIVERSFLTGASGFRFVNFMEVWVVFEDSTGDIVGHGFTGASGLYRGPSFLNTPSQIGPTTQAVRVGQGPLLFTQMTGARTAAPELIGGGIFGPLGNILGSAAKSFPPIWTEIKIEVFPNGESVAKVTRHSLFPSISFYKRNDIKPTGDTTPTGPYFRIDLTGNKRPSETAAQNWAKAMEDFRKGVYPAAPVAGKPYDGMPNQDEWYEFGWGSISASKGGGVPCRGNPWGMEKSVLSGIDPTQPFGW